MTTDGGSAGRRPALLIAAGAGLAVLVLLGSVLFFSQSSTRNIAQSTDEPAAETEDAVTTDPATTGPTGEVLPGQDASSQPAEIAEPTGLPFPVREEVALGDPAELDNGISAGIVGIDIVQTDSKDRGALAGEALVVRVSLTNGSDRALAGDLTSVTAYFGESLTPGTTQPGDSRWSPIGGEMTQGETAEGAYVISAPPGFDGQVRVVVIPDGASQGFVFSGELSR